MAHSRLERIGTIYTRITSLIRTGAMKLEERPLWYEVYQAFPPATPPRFDNPAPAGEIRKIFYPEDVVRAKYYSAIRSGPAINLNEDGRPSHCQVFLDNCKRLSSAKGVTIDDVFDEALSLTRQALTAQTETSGMSVSKSIVSKTPESGRPVQEKSSVNMKNILSEDDALPPESSQPKTT